MDDTQAPVLPQSSAFSMLAQAKQECTESGELVKLVLGGVRRIDSWLIENRVVPRLREQGAAALHFILAPPGGEKRSAVLLPLADGAALALSTTDRWSILERLEALSAVQYIGYRYAPENEWSPDFEAMLEIGNQPPRPVTPFEVAEIWREITGLKPAGFEAGTLDEMESLGLKLIGRIFNSQGRLGL